MPFLLFSGSQINCFAPTSFSWRQAAYVDSFCWAAVQQNHLSQSDSGNVPLWLHKDSDYVTCCRDEFTSNIRTGILKNDTTLPSLVQCKLIAVGLLRFLSYINLIVYILTMPFIIYAIFVPFRETINVLKVNVALPKFSVQQTPAKSYDDHSLFLEENVSELKSYRFLKVLENIKNTGENFDTMQYLISLGTVKMDTVDGNLTFKCASEVPDNKEKDVVELAVQPLSDNAKTEEKKVLQRLLDSSY
ncbi:hypothetical protein XELAEV_18016285mg [Xenopus laevis]|uniref:Uncharacterized protein n=1 Tax=Xenopus laevis TaxID=8355 RepID=A0A974DKR6_XENLA|nr:hypothetical protein XELAEV_18016285mg [Xenopus laevis]